MNGMPLHFLELTGQYAQRASVAGGGPITDNLFFR